MKILAQGVGSLAWFLLSQGEVFHTLCLRSGEFTHSKKFSRVWPREEGGWSGLELTDTLALKALGEGVFHPPVRFLADNV